MRIGSSFIPLCTWKPTAMHACHQPDKRGLASAPARRSLSDSVASVTCRSSRFLSRKRFCRSLHPHAAARLMQGWSAGLHKEGGGESDAFQHTMQALGACAMTCSCGVLLGLACDCSSCHWPARTLSARLNEQRTTNCDLTSCVLIGFWQSCLRVEHRLKASQWVLCEGTALLTLVTLQDNGKHNARNVPQLLCNQRHLLPGTFQQYSTHLSSAYNPNVLLTN